MALSIKDPEADRLARELSRQTGETLTEAVVVALRERLARQRREKNAPARRERIRAACDALRSLHDLPSRDARSADEILGYGPGGWPE
jgi:antitoxin VapB